jgi:ADP-ribose pyrophosphatase YjhB (NUDIX family)
MPATKFQAWTDEIQRIAQTGLSYCKDPHDLKRFQRLTEIAAHMAAIGWRAEFQTILSTFRAQDGYPTPKVDVRAGVFQEEKVLLVRDVSDALWTLPGGWADPGESPSEAIWKEILEESGYQARVTKLVAVFDRGRHGHPPLPFQVYKLFFLAEITGGSPHPGEETSEVAFFPVNALPPLSETRVVPEEILLLHAHHRTSSLPTVFD